MLSDIQIATLESAAELFDGLDGLERGCREYKRELRVLNGDEWKTNLANLERSNPAAYTSVCATIPENRKSELSAFIAQYKSQPLPEVQRASTLSEAKAIAAAKGGGTVVKP